MYLQKVKSKNAISYYAAKTFYDENGKKSSKIVEKLGTQEELEKIYPDPMSFLKQRVAELTEQEKSQQREVIVKFSQSELIEQNSPAKFNCGYLFLQKIYYELGIDKICKQVEEKYKFEYDLNDILSRIVYGRILSPSSKLGTAKFAKTLLEQPKFDLHQIYRALEVIAKEDQLIQSELYKNSSKVVPRNSNILYYDCTNYFFEIEEEDGIKKYGASKEHRPNPIIQMGLFMDGDGIPLAYSINPGNTNEQTTLIPLEKTIIQDFGKSKLVVCTDAGLSSIANRKFNNVADRAFITVQSIKKMKEFQKSWALERTGWRLPGSKQTYTIDEILDHHDENYSKIFYKEQWFNENDIEQRFIVSFSIKYKEYTEMLRTRHIQRAQKLIETGSYKKKRETDPTRLIGQYYMTEEGEIADDSIAFLDTSKIETEAAYDGFYCVATNLEDPVEAVLKINGRRWEIEESFRIMKSEFKARPVFLRRGDRIKAHFLTCFLALTIYRILEKKLKEQFTTDVLIGTLRSMELYKINGEGFIPVYTRNDVTDCLHESFGFRTDYQLSSINSLKKIFKLSKKA